MSRYLASTPHWCRLCVGTGSTEGARTEQTASRCWKRADTKRGPTQSSRGRMVVRMVVITGEVGGRWSEETKNYSAHSEARVLRGNVKAAWCPPTAHEVVSATFREVWAVLTRTTCSFSVFSSISLSQRTKDFKLQLQLT